MEQIPQEYLGDTGPELNVVELELDDGSLELIVYGPGPEFCIDEVAYIPAEHLGDLG